MNFLKQFWIVYRHYHGSSPKTFVFPLHYFFIHILDILQDLSKRIDLRDFCIVSIDPPGCTDIDDALHCRQLENGNYEVIRPIKIISNRFYLNCSVVFISLM